MNGLDGLEKSDIRDLLGKGWLTHDAMWFYHTCRQSGMEKANEINRAAIRAMAPIEMERAKRLLGIDSSALSTFDGLRDFMFRTLEVILPASIYKKARFTAPTGGLIHWRWEDQQCFAYRGMKQIGMIDGYRCGVMFRIGCWLDALGITHAMRPEIEGCLMRDKGACEGDIHIVGIPQKTSQP